MEKKLIGREDASRWLAAALSLQLLLTFFAPPVPVGDKRIYLSDLWCILWLLAGLLWFGRAFPSKIKSLGVYLAGSGVVISLIFLNGMTNETWRQEAIVATRFLSWLWAAGLVAASVRHMELTEARKVVQALSWVLCFCVLAMTLVFFSEFASAPAREVLHLLYLPGGKLPWYWEGRATGTFSSPVEGGIALGLALILAVWLAQEKKVRLGLIILGFCSIALTHTATAMLALLMVVMALGTLRVWPRLSTLRKTTFALLLLAAIGVVITGLVLAHPHVHFIQQKAINFRERVHPWLGLISSLSYSPRSLLLGLGFLPHAVDNFYLWLLSRGGIVLMVISLIAVHRFQKQAWPVLSWGGKGVVLFLLIAGLTFDVLILRHVVALLLAMAIPALVLDLRRPSNPA